MISQYVTHETSHVYCLQNLPEEVVAVLFAYYSRSRGTLRENLELLLGEGMLAAAPAGALPEHATQKAADFHDRWTVGYGHSSVAEHAVVHVAVENVSIQVLKIIEDCRLASYTEKRTRYVPFTRDRLYEPPASTFPEPRHPGPLPERDGHAVHHR